MKRRFFQWVGLANLAIGTKLKLLVLLSSALGLALAAILLVTYNNRVTHDQAAIDLQTLTRIVADNTAAALVFNDDQAAIKTLSALKAKPEVDSACLYRSEAGRPPKLFASYLRTGLDCPAAPAAGGVREDREWMMAVATVILDGERAGLLYVSQNLRPLRKVLSTQLLIACGVFLLSFLLSVGVASVLQRAITEPILRLSSAVRRVAQTRDFHLRVPAGGSDEVGALIEGFNRMLGYLQAGQADIQQSQDVLTEEVRERSRANDKLEQALQQLRDAQAQLVQSEKMASLGALVAGVAHEINTPVGVAVSAASTLQEHVARLAKQHQHGAITSSGLLRFVGMAEESTKLILNNLERAAALIQSFKQVAVDQSSGEHRLFALGSYLDEVASNLKPELRKGGHRIEVHCPDTLMVDSYPGALAQVVTNLVTNSLIHGYDHDQPGQIRIEAEVCDGEVSLHYRDDGRGIPPEHRAKVFDPFFTTRRGAGGSGLGLHIVYNLVTQLLRGSIRLGEEIGGASFLIRFPASLREQKT
ncbi:MAG: ATP-binding protein [Pseudomonadota bacterium]